MPSKADFQRAIADTIDRYPDLSARYRARDPIILQHLEAIATMLAMLSSSTDVAQSEVFAKARDATVLADAAMRGIVPKARPAQATLKVRNTGTTTAQVTAGRILQDSRARPWVVTAGADIPPGAEGAIQAEQKHTVETVHTIARDEPFHAVEIARALADGQHLCAFSVRDDDGEWTYAERYTNVFSGDRIYHVEADERQRVYVRFGMRDVVGVQPNVGDTLTFRMHYTHGAITQNGSLSFDAIQSPSDAFLIMAVDTMTTSGEDPIGIDTLRTLARYPSVYDHDAVYLGEFDFLIRRHFPDVRFLSVWNERIEERARGPSVDHINVLFVACLSADGTESVADASDFTHGAHIEGVDLTSVQQAISAVIARADDSYRVRFVTPLRAPQQWHIQALIGSAYLPDVIEQRIREVVLEYFGADAMRRGGANFSLQNIYATLRGAIPEISEAGSDIAVSIPDQSIEPVPETWRYVAPESLLVEVRAAGVTPPAWGW